MTTWANAMQTKETFTDPRRDDEDEIYTVNLGDFDGEGAAWKVNVIDGMPIPDGVPATKYKLFKKKRDMYNYMKKYNLEEGYGYCHTAPDELF